MVKYPDRALNRVYGALSDATRRALLEQLAEKEMPVSELAGPFRISLPAISKHLRVLENAGLLAREKQGRVMKCRLIASSLQSAGEWLASYRTFWQSRFDALEKYILEGRQGSPRTAKRPRWSAKAARTQIPTHAKIGPLTGPDSLDATFSALADATRRKILARLRSGPATVTELAEPFVISLPAISKHVSVLENAGLLVRARAGRMQSCRLLASPLQDASVWIGRSFKIGEVYGRCRSAI